MKWCPVGSQVGFGCDFTPPSDITRVFFCLFFSGLEMLHLNQSVAHVEGCPSSRAPQDSSRPCWVLDFQAWELGMIPLQQKGWDHHCSLLPHHLPAELLVGYPKEQPQPQTCSQGSSYPWDGDDFLNYCCTLMQLRLCKQTRRKHSKSMLQKYIFTLTA